MATVDAGVVFVAANKMRHAADGIFEEANRISDTGCRESVRALASEVKREARRLLNDR